MKEDASVECSDCGCYWTSLKELRDSIKLAARDKVDEDPKRKREESSEEESEEEKKDLASLSSEEHFKLLEEFAREHITQIIKKAKAEKSPKLELYSKFASNLDLVVPQNPTQKKEWNKSEVLESLRKSIYGRMNRYRQVTSETLDKAKPPIPVPQKYTSSRQMITKEAPFDSCMYVDEKKSTKVFDDDFKLRCSGIITTNKGEVKYHESCLKEFDLKIQDIATVNQFELDHEIERGIINQMLVQVMQAKQKVNWKCFAELQYHIRTPGLPNGNVVIRCKNCVGQGAGRHEELGYKISTENLIQK